MICRYKIPNENEFLNKIFMIYFEKYNKFLKIQNSTLLDFSRVFEEIDTEK